MSYQEIDPARAKSKDPEDFWEDPEWVAEEKLNGWRFLMHTGRELARVFMTGRRLSSVTGRLSEKGECCPQIWVPNLGRGYTVLDGEVVAPTKFHDVAGIMNVDPEDAQKRIAEIGPPSYRIFDVLFYDGQDLRELSMLERRMILESQVIEHLRSPNVSIVPQIKKDKKSFYESVVARGGEGVILKDVCATYGESKAWIKVKKTYPIDVVVTGFTDARFGRTGKYHGQIGAVLCSVYTTSGQLLEIAQVSGMDDATRRAMTDDKESWTGRVIEIEAQEWGKDRLLHPRFVRERPDADPKSCTFAKMMAELKREAAKEEPRQGRLL